MRCSHSAVQHFKNWSRIGDKTSMSLIKISKQLSPRTVIQFPVVFCLQFTCFSLRNVGIWLNGIEWNLMFNGTKAGFGYAAPDTEQNAVSYPHTRDQTGN
ncbi:hypothetical protein AVEN_268985-1 [Araneus ventricosus]|uniref:Uncharacterized protein n=1 Tax=Araneus ventricosus TaxID=182803 RepID=A0A4Y2HJ33_ARAVE|nr:hypothetical protein AVEN_268985-1 [Araneus ventricosus]